MTDDNNQSTEVLKQLLEYMQGDFALRTAHLETQRADLKERKWKNRLVGLITASSAVIFILALVGAISDKTVFGDYVAMVRVDGEISPTHPASASNLLPALKEAFEDKSAKGVLLLINSPGGTPVQASLIHDAVVRLRKQYPDKRVVAVGEDMVTSGAYWIASSAPEIYVNESTLTGSIGVISSGFGVDLTKFKQYGIERRVTTAGSQKDRNDPFLPQHQEDLQKIKDVIADMHTHFIHAVMETRGDKIKSDPKTLFTGDYWTGKQAVQLGLADGLSDLASVMHDKFNVKKAADYTPQQGLFDKARRSFGVEAVMDAVTSKMSSTPSTPVFLAM